MLFQVQAEALVISVSLTLFLCSRHSFNLHTQIPAIQYAKYMGRRVISIDTGEEKRKLCTELGSDHWIDFQTSKDVTAEIKQVTDGKGAHAAIVTTASVRFR